MRRILFAVIVALAALGVASALSSASAQVSDPLGPPPPDQPPPPPNDQPAPDEAAPPTPPVPDASGTGRRIVYSNGQQRIWLVEDDGSVTRTHLVSGRRNFPRPGNYAVFSRSPSSRAGGVTLQYMVRWARTKGLSVGFHAIPVNRRGRPIQGEDELGQYRSHGCVRQRVADAAFVWDWAPIGTPVVVVR
jgi:lipoprotein-anchoring transpeptidase ErfK/SrfK